MAQAGKALESYFEAKLQEVYSDRTFTPLMESDSDHEETHISEDSDDDFVQPRRKRLKSDDRPVHIK